MKIYTIIILSLLIFSLYTPVAFSAPAKPVDLVIFVGEGCPHCAKMKEYINDLKNTDFPNINIIEYEVYHDVDNQNLMDRYAKAYNTTSQYVPLTFIGDNAISGENKNELQRLLTLCQVKSCESPEKIVEKFMPGPLTLIVKKQKTGQSKFRARKTAEQKKKGRRQGFGSRKGAKKARSPAKQNWMNTIRLQRTFLRLLRNKNILSVDNYRMLLLKSKGGFFRNKRHIKIYLQERGVLKKNE